jgi:hypothetical protein
LEGYCAFRSAFLRNVIFLRGGLMRAIFGLLCVLSFSPAPLMSEDPFAGDERLAAVETLLSEIASRFDECADGLPKDLEMAVDRWTHQSDTV